MLIGGYKGGISVSGEKYAIIDLILVMVKLNIRG